MISFGKSVCLSELHANIWHWFNQPASVPESQGLWWPLNVKYCYFSNNVWESCARRVLVRKCSQTWMKRAAGRVWPFSQWAPTHAPRAAVFPLWSHLLCLCGSVEKQSMNCSDWFTAVLLGLFCRSICSCVLTDEDILNLCVLSLALLLFSLFRPSFGPFWCSMWAVRAINLGRG